MNALFTFTIGPVKSFVENGRKMQDMYAGSHILSILTKCAIKYLNERAKVIFPIVQKYGDVENDNYPNRLVAIIENFTQKFGVDLAEELEKKVREHYKVLYNAVLDKAFNQLEGYEKQRKEAARQLENFLEIYWLFVEYDTDREYMKAYRELFNKLQAIKSIRPFKQSDEEWGRKCYLHPEYNAIFVRKFESKSTDRLLPHNSNEQHIVELDSLGELKYKLKPGEALSAVALFKRLDEASDNIDSVRYLVLKNWLKFTKREKYIYDLEEFAPLNRTYIVDALYDLYNEIEPSKEDYPGTYIKKAKELYNAEFKGQKVNLSSYYAMIKFDGDSMGKIYRELCSEDDHRKLSKNICEFANKAKQVINEKGHCIYAGGEDVLGFLPLDNLWETLETLHRIFACMLKRGIKGTVDFTFSAGIVVAHLMQPLKDVMQQVDEAEKRAKSVDGKNAFAVTVMKRGGENRSVWHQFNEYEVLNAINETINSLKGKEFSKALIFDCCKVLSQLTEEVSEALVEGIIRQIVLQKLPRMKDKAEEIIKAILKLYNPKKGLPIFIDTLDLISFLAREVN